jgi:hypothetical protein
MAHKPNYRFERAQRERRQAERQALRDLRRARNRGDTAPHSEQPAPEATDAGAKPGEDLPERRDV